MKIFEFKYPEGETDWVLAYDQEDAEEFYISETGCVDLEGVEVSEVPEEDWPKRYVLDIDDPEPDKSENYDPDDYRDGYKIQETFAQFAERNKESRCIIATTEF